MEDSVRRGELADLEAYRAGPSAPRPVGATHISTRAHKIAYSLQDDQLLWDWVQPYEKDPRAPISGNLIYKQLAEKVGPYLPRLVLCEFYFVIRLRFLSALSTRDILGNLTVIGI